MAEYKAGDKVKCEQNIDTPLTTTDIYTVREMLRQTGTDRYMLILEEFEHLGFWEYRFVKAQE